MEDSLNRVKKRLNEEAKVVYEILKSKSSTYGELEERISRETKELGWEDTECAAYLNSKLMGFLKEESGSLSIK